MRRTRKVQWRRCRKWKGFWCLLLGKRSVRFSGRHFQILTLVFQIYIWQLKDNDLVGVAFIDTQIYTHQILSIKSLILVADVYKSIALLRFQEEYRTLSLVSRDFRPCEVFAIEYLIDNTSMGFLLSDSEKNLVLYMYQPESRESFGGISYTRDYKFVW